MFKIRFGTSGWRAIMADEFTFANVKCVCQAISKYLKDHKLQTRPVVIGYDTRFLSKEFAQVCAQSLSKSNINVLLTQRDAPTPVIAFQILAKKAAGGINITASHNPPEYNGIKFSPAHGGPAEVEVTSEIEKNINSQVYFPSRKEARVEMFDPRPGYLERIKQLVNFKAITQASLKVGVDVLYGTGRDYLDLLLKQAGCAVTLLHQNLDPYFGGLPPEPAQRQLKQLSQLVREQKLDLGLAVDGDADRFGIIDADGSYIDANQVLALLADHLIKTRPAQKYLARTMATTHIIDALAQESGLQAVETPVGFKYIGQEIAKGQCLIGGEESGGLSIAGHVPEKDGILACLLVAELAAVRKKSLAGILKELYERLGPYYTGRANFHLSNEAKTKVVREIKLFCNKTTLLNKKIARVIDTDGYKFIFEDNSWLMFRVSGTEPVLRAYAEAASKAGVDELLNFAQALIKG